ncbi:Transcription factor TFIIIC, triple barrel domain [Fusarium oxysporum f. sp. vasinfectum]|nr:Transcription factor TFIIIC, triple barrel domain [Fusarium oxysporum f. sp. vasinfectum]
MASLDEARLADKAAIVNIEEQLGRDEQEEWEYEYSTTETETYYLTVDLSFPEFKDRQPRAPHHSRGGGEPEDDTRDDVDKTRGENENIQILELHSEKPVISYKGRTFEGSWAEVIGTEAIFATRDSDRPLPALRHLDGNIDFLGACASRIATKETVVKPKIIREDPLAAIREEWNIRIPVGKDRSGERAEQTRFLENLMAIKKRNKEKDQVTAKKKIAQ